MYDLSQTNSLEGEINWEKRIKREILNFLSDVVMLAIAKNLATGYLVSWDQGEITLNPSVQVQGQWKSKAHPEIATDLQGFIMNKSPFSPSHGFSMCSLCPAPHLPSKNLSPPLVLAFSSLPPSIYAPYPFPPRLSQEPYTLFLYNTGCIPPPLNLGTS